ncbi:MAG: transporter substrate-binding domain-containing protein [Lachnospiraceae bacterium]|jgi:polar amino acid transport system substrate-binding protein|nr:transporter substrate-binding domain-containing protein [Lachnospiraceae bacterium]
MKRLMALMLAGVMTAAMVAGCGQKSAETTAETPEETTQEATPDASDTETPEADPETPEETTSSEESDLAYVQGKGTLVVGITDFEPMDYKDESGNWIGFDADMAAAFAKSLGVSVEFVEIDWDNKIMELDGKTIDCVWNGMTLTDEVKSAMECSNAYCNNAQIVIVPADKAEQYQDKESLKELTFAVEAGSAGEAQVTELGAEFTPVTTQANALMEVAAGSSDAAVIDSLMAAAMVGEGTGYANLTYTVQLNSEEYGVGFRKGSDLAAALNEFFVTAYTDGSMVATAETYGVQAAVIEQK